MKDSVIVSTLAALALAPALARAEGGFAGLLKTATSAVSDAANNLTDAVMDAIGGNSKTSTTPAPCDNAQNMDEDEEEPVATASGALSLGGKSATQGKAGKGEDTAGFSLGNALFQAAGGKSDAAPQTESRTIEVVAKGFGVDAKSSEKAALRAAVEQVVGQLMDASTLVENDELVEDKILTFANGFVKTYEIIGTPKAGADGLVSTTVKAIVEKGQIAQKVREITKTETEVSGKGLFAELATRQTSMADAKAMFDELFKDVPLKLLKADTVKKADGTPSFRLDAETGELLIDVELGVDPEKYAAWTSDMMQKLGKMAAKTYSFGIKSFNGRDSSVDANLDLRPDISGHPNPAAFETVRPIVEDLKDLYCYVRVAIPSSLSLYGFTASKNRFKIFGYGLSKDVGVSLDIGGLHDHYRSNRPFAPADARITAKAILKDASGNAIAEARGKEFRPGHGYREPSCRFVCSTDGCGSMWILPGWIREDSDSFGAKLRLLVNMGKFDPEELKDVTQIVCEPVDVR